jgi:hypothetical protein
MKLKEIHLKPEQQECLEKAVEEMAADPDIKALVLDIEKRPLTTQHHYDDYGGVIFCLTKGSKLTAYILGEAMKRCGAHPVGVDNAINLFF